MRLANRQSFVAKGITCLVFLLWISRESIAQLHYNHGDPEFTLEYCLKLFAYNGVVERKYEPIIYEQFLNSHSKSKQIRNVKRVEVVKDKIFVGQQTYDTGGYILLNENYCTTCRKYSDTLWRGYSKYTYSSDRLRVVMIERVDSITTHKLFIFNARELIDTVIDYNPSNSGILSKLCYCYDTADRITSIWLCDSAGNRMVSNLLYYSWKNKYDLFGHVNMMYIPFGVDSAILNPAIGGDKGDPLFFFSVFDTSNSVEYPNYNYFLYGNNVLYIYQDHETDDHGRQFRHWSKRQKFSFYKWDKKGRHDHYFKYIWMHASSIPRDTITSEQYHRKKNGKWRGKTSYIVTRYKHGPKLKKIITYY